MANARHSKSTFRGFRSPTYTQVPDELFDELLPELSGAELKVLLYIIRRTFGFKRDSDSISLSQMLNGVHARDGTVFDRGAGVSKPTLLQALRSLEEGGSSPPNGGGVPRKATNPRSTPCALPPIARRRKNPYPPW